MKYRIKNLLVSLSLLAIIIGSTAVVTRIMTIKQIERYYEELPYIWEEVDFAESPWVLLWGTVSTNGSEKSDSWWNYSNESFIFEVEGGYFFYILITTFEANYFVKYEGRIRTSIEFTFDEPVSKFYVANVTCWRVVK